MKNRNATSAQTPKELLNDLHALVADAEKMMSETVSEHTDDAISAMRTRFEAAQERLGELYEGARTKVAAGAKYTDETIRANPYQSIAIAAGVGLLVGVLLGRRNT
jgi:ElaB/YqjD/DUF883 family membrane-anchored ribosome-binding protein